MYRLVLELYVEVAEESKEGPLTDMSDGLAAVEIDRHLVGD